MWVVENPIDNSHHEWCWCRGRCTAVGSIEILSKCRLYCWKCGGWWSAWVMKLCKGCWKRHFATDVPLAGLKRLVAVAALIWLKAGQLFLRSLEVDWTPWPVWPQYEQRLLCPFCLWLSSSCFLDFWYELRIELADWFSRRRVADLFLASSTSTNLNAFFNSDVLRHPIEYRFSYTSAENISKYGFSVVENIVTGGHLMLNLGSLWSCCMLLSVTGNRKIPFPDCKWSHSSEYISFWHVCKRCNTRACYIFTECVITAF